MKTRWKQIALTMIFALGMLSAQAQTAGIDPALLARANAGDAAAQVQVGESYAAGKDVARDLKLAAEWYGKQPAKATSPQSCIWPRSIATEARASPATWSRPRPGIARQPSRAT